MTQSTIIQVEQCLSVSVSVCLSFCLSASLSLLPVCLSRSLSLCLSVSLSSFSLSLSLSFRRNKGRATDHDQVDDTIYYYTGLSSFCLSICLFLSAYLSLSVYLFRSVSICLSLSVSLGPNSWHNYTIKPSSSLLIINDPNFWPKLRRCFHTFFQNPSAAFNLSREICARTEDCQVKLILY